ncbi:MAG: nucleoside deaminase [Ignavibacteria bacterium]|nr:nucleoside deaminase [Ignavibacteria bacterium]
MPYRSKFMQEAIRLSEENLSKYNGGPFGAVIVRNDKIISKGVNLVISTNDPTAHAEIVAIRKACKKLKKIWLDDCEIYTSCEPCPMCLSAIYWARIKKIYFANTRKDAEKIGFIDKEIYDELSVPSFKRKIKSEQHLRSKAIEVFEKWKKGLINLKY